MLAPKAIDAKAKGTGIAQPRKDSMACCIPSASTAVFSCTLQTKRCKHFMWSRMFMMCSPMCSGMCFRLDSFTDSFGIVDTLTGGGPYRATDLMVYRIYSEGFKGMNYSGAAAQSVILMLLVMALTFVQFRYVERRVHYT